MYKKENTNNLEWLFFSKFEKVRESEKDFTFTPVISKTSKKLVRSVSDLTVILFIN